MSIMTIIDGNGKPKKLHHSNADVENRSLRPMAVTQIYLGINFQNVLQEVPKANVWATKLDRN